MSSPNARERPTRAQRALIGFHQRAAHGRRVRLLVEALRPRVPSRSSLLDLGCGDLRIAAGLREACGLRRCVGADVWPARVSPPPGCEYRALDLAKPLPWRAAEFDVVLLIDVLHHAREPAELLREALRVGGVVLVKDHYEYGRGSRLVLRLLDWLGNRAYGVPVPGRYFTPATFDALLLEVSAQAEIDVGLDLYGHIPFGRLVAPPELHFIARLERADAAAARIPA